jgi:hypothetical protein
MSDLPARYPPLLPAPFKAACVICFGLLLAAVIMLMIAPEQLTWVLSHFE